MRATTKDGWAEVIKGKPTVGQVAEQQGDPGAHSARTLGRADIGGAAVFLTTLAARYNHGGR